jgi:uncharacterized protein YfbU (UPF0304 family)
MNYLCILPFELKIEIMNALTQPVFKSVDAIELFVKTISGIVDLDVECTKQYIKFQHVDLRGSAITDVSALKNVNTLKLSNCKGVTDVSSLGNVQELNLSYTNVKDVSALGGVHTLKLNGCKRVTDVSALDNVHILNLHGCINVTDISMNT